MPSVSSPTPAPARVCVTLSSHAARPVDPLQQRRSYCASGHIFTGVLELSDASGETTLRMPVLTGGWMSLDSPFHREGLCPQNATWGSYDPLLYPDTAFPALPGETRLGTERTGSLRGFRVPDPPGTGRSALMVHDSSRYGSEGCICTPDPELWERFCDEMARLFLSGITSIPLRVVYTCPSPEPRRCPHLA